MGMDIDEHYRGAQPMKKLFPEAPDVPQSVANKAIRIVEKHLRIHRVDRAKDLPEEAKVRLLLELRRFFEAESEGGRGKPAEPPEKGNWLSRILERIDRILGIGDL